MVKLYMEAIVIYEKVKVKIVNSKEQPKLPY